LQNALYNFEMAHADLQICDLNLTPTLILTQTLNLILTNQTVYDIMQIAQTRSLPRLSDQGRMLAMSHVRG